jgi:hypothetical protein
MPGNGGTLILISDNYNVQRHVDGLKITTLKLFGANMLLGRFSKAEKNHKKTPTTPTDADKGVSTTVVTENKGNVTHRFNSSDASLVETITYDNFGSPAITRVQSVGVVGL